MKVQIVKLGTIVTDIATGRDGMLTLMQIAQDQSQDYFFQPCALNPEKQEPVEGFWLKKERLAGFTIEEIDAPLQVLGTIVTEKATRFTGRAINILIHATGCVHIDIQPPGSLAKTGASVRPHNFSILRLTGEAIPSLNAAAEAQERASRPSPGEHPRCEPTATA